MSPPSELTVEFLVELQALIEGRRADEALSLWRSRAASLENLTLAEGQRVREELRQVLIRTELLRDSLLQEHQALQRKRRTSKAYSAAVTSGG